MFEKKIQVFLGICISLIALFAIGPMHFIEALPVKKSEENGSSLEPLNRLANDRTAKPSARARAIFALFREHLKPGDRQLKVSQVLVITCWLKETRLYFFGSLAGWIPIGFNPNDRSYCLHLFPDNEGHSDFVVYFRLSGNPCTGNWKEEGYSFLRGEKNTKDQSILIEYALCSPGGRIELFSDKK